ncbi:MAG: trypsin-like peptidase domain-containing protein [Mariniblastus sp.]|nr:trypsin-like peptidase domain-containing protein [Mariniblastus sp.]
MRLASQQTSKRTFACLIAFPLFMMLWLCSAVVMGQEEENSNETSAANKPSISLDFLNEGTAPSSIEQLRLMEEQVLKIADMVKPATVNIAVGESQGTGVVISRDGYILTAAHVINRPGLNARITFPDGQVTFATTLGTHPGIDSGMLKLNTPGKWPYLDVGESESLKRGQWVIAIGHPGGLDKDRGLVVRVGRLIYKSRSVLRTDCTLVGGDSGGPLVDMDGYVIGIHSRIGSSLTDNLHVPIDIFSEEWDMLADDFGVVVGSSTAYLGMSLDSGTNVVNRVNPNQPAAKAGIQVGDKIIQIGEAKIESPADLRRALRDKKPRDEVVIRVSRKEKIRPKQDKDSEDKDSEDKDSEDKDSEDKDSEDKTKQVELDVTVTLGYG